MLFFLCFYATAQNNNNKRQIAAAKSKNVLLFIITKATTTTTKNYEFFTIFTVSLTGSVRWWEKRNVFHCSFWRYHQSEIKASLIYSLGNGINSDNQKRKISAIKEKENEKHKRRKNAEKFKLIQFSCIFFLLSFASFICWGFVVVITVGCWEEWELCFMFV